MKAKYGDAEVCPKCNGTGMRVYKLGRVSYAVPCFYTGYETHGQLTLVEIAVTRAKGRITKRANRRGNRWHTKN